MTNLIAEIKRQKQIFDSMAATAPNKDILHDTLSNLWTLNDDIGKHGDESESNEANDIFSDAQRKYNSLFNTGK